MKIEGIIWLRDVVDKLALKHHIETQGVEEALSGKPKFRFVEKGEREGEGVYLALGRTSAGRYLSVLFIYKKPFLRKKSFTKRKNMKINFRGDRHDK